MTTKSTNNATARLSNADETAVTYVYAAGARHDASCFAVVEALLDAGLVGDLDVYRPTGDPRGDVAALCASNVVGSRRRRAHRIGCHRGHHGIRTGCPGL
jgi:hypothetical protein